MIDPTTTEGIAAARHDRRLMALYYAWGREDAGDRRLRDLSQNRVLALDFAAFAADEAGAFAREKTSSLSAVQDQYARYIAARTVGARLIDQDTGDEIEIIAYDDETNHVDAHTIRSSARPEHVGRLLTSSATTFARRPYAPTNGGNRS
jgi:hypothetical protein